MSNVDPFDLPPWRRFNEDAGAWEVRRGAVQSAPIPMFLTCPSCCARHIDEGEFATKPHHTHACQRCGLTWRPAVECTVGVHFLPGFKNETPGTRCDHLRIRNDGMGAEMRSECLDCGSTDPYSDAVKP